MISFHFIILLYYYVIYILLIYNSSSAMADEFEALADAIRGSQAKEVKKMLRRSKRLAYCADQFGQTALHIASAGGALPVVKLLVEKYKPLINLGDKSNWTT